ncbi:MAG: Capsule synthesis protein, CapA [Firmicutes bacterium]|nr:Capsule synthesis protein, CapA [Bacillota bacterium]
MWFKSISALLLIMAVLTFMPLIFSQKVKAETLEPPMENISPSTTAQGKKQIVITAIGDCTLATDATFGYDSTLPAVIDANNGDLAYVFKGIHQVTSVDDLTIANLEGTFTTSSARYPKTFAFKGPPEYAKMLTLGSIEAVNLANNHTYDYYEAGFEDTIKALDREGILWLGEGTAKVYKTKGFKIGLLGYAFTIDETQLAKEISALKDITDIVVVSFHWGEEGSYWPNSEQNILARLSIDSGADIVIGHHPHVLQGIEIYKNRLIAYSLGNFAFGGNMNPQDKRTMLLQVKFTTNEKGVQMPDAKIVPARISSATWINDYQPTILEGEDRQTFLEWFQPLCSGVQLQNGEIKIF